MQRLSGAEWELLINTNAHTDNQWPDDPRIRMVVSGRVGPADKRDQCARLATGDVLVFLDDDSYPSANFLETASVLFSLPNFHAVGGPAITPTEDSFWQRVSGASFTSRLTGGNPHRYLPLGKTRIVDDWPSVNFLVRRDAFFAVGGFSSPYWPGEDTLLCNKLVENGYKIWYVPDLRVWHHRRSGLRRHLQQVGNYGRHRGYFARRYPTNSRKVKYFIPSAFVVLFVLFALLALTAGIWWPALLLGSSYLVAVGGAAMMIARRDGLSIGVAVIPFVVSSHFSYGLQFLRGFATFSEFKSRLR